MHYNGIEKRKFKRVRCPCKIWIYSISEHTILTHTENISAGGVRVLIEEKLDIDSIVGIEVKLKENTIACKGRIVWVVNRHSPYKKGICYNDTGIEFLEITDRQRDCIDKFIENICK